MPIEEMTNEALAAHHSEMMSKARAARAENDLDMAQMYLAVVRPMNVEMLRRMRAK
jgi:hypothetical protein